MKLLFKLQIVNSKSVIWVKMKAILWNNVKIIGKRVILLQKNCNFAF